MFLTLQPIGASAATAEVSERELRETIDRLVGFGTRHTLSDTKSETRGIGAARRYGAARFAEFSKSCGGCLVVEAPSSMMTSPRVPVPAEIVDVLAIQRGTSDPDRVVIISAHIDSRNSDVMDNSGDAPGANDDGSGSAAVIEAARVLSRQKFPATIVYALLSGEEQGLLGGKLLAETAKTKSWRVEAVLNNDIVGNSGGSSGTRDDRTVRVFSEGTKATETPEQAGRRRYNGGEVDSPARNLSRFIAGLEGKSGLRVEQVYRTDRFGRGGDQVPMLAAGFPSVRITERQENYDRQHQNVRTENGRKFGDTVDGVDFPYLAKVTRLNIAALAALAGAPAPPSGVIVEGAVTPDTKLSWKPVAGAKSYRVWWRPTTAATWTTSRDVPGDTTSIVLPGIDIDTWFFGVSAVSADGLSSPVVYPGPAGAFFAEPAAPTG
ncbi:peptidase M28 [Polymorphobacter glacialis]|uniref:Peptidase M28 n=2 Tax=Sandarakinorhabdus glacialis TaxID=1614636 RepID=A0A917E2K1_9SPHN|nr:peptidase M28 [Polymorphobacter glacialis]